MPKPYCIGLVGRIGTGKSAALNIFKSLNIPIISADEINRTLLKPGKAAYQAIVNKSQEEVLNQDKTLNTQLLREKMLADPNYKAFLEALLHPLVRQEIKAQIKVLSPDFPFCIIEIPLIINKNDYPYLNKILCIACDQTLQLKRILQRKNMTLAIANKLINMQASQEEYLAIADDVIENNSSLQNLKNKVLKLHAKYTQNP
ncbi:MAG: dephospho-CoA kinase [Legionellales bacterium RIFCSPHIGHO2_12_FULL_37_14]|nr:MAG: dephospho-CoA kinase [Legionellales bacterium RIFCSPHIGHO2_12_FULL_37_14]